MKSTVIIQQPQRQRNIDRPLFRISPIAAFVTGLTLSVGALPIAAPVHAADARSATEIQAEVARLKQLLEQEEQALAAKNNTPGCNG